MPKKNKRVYRSSAASAAAGTPTYTPVSRTPEATFNPDYKPVIKDLRRIGILAGTFFVLLIALSFLMPWIEPLILR